MIKMKKIILFLVTLFLIPFFVTAQKTNKARGKKIKALKIAFITEELNLASNEAEKFWPVYNKFDNLLFQLERVEKFKIRIAIKDAGGIENIPEKEAKSMLKKIADLESEIYEAKILYDKELSEVLSFKKILKLKASEKEFIRGLMKKYRRNKSK
tara:strand:+ start:161 stop:625 length:465 start_codon:yes stop_codon:yes gene_type:complete